MLWRKNEWNHAEWETTANIHIAWLVQLSFYMINTTPISICTENPKGCSFQVLSYKKGEEHSSIGMEQHILIFCQSGHIRITSNLFAEEYLCAGEILFIPRDSDYHGMALSDTTLLIHCFNNTVCHIENCILSFLYTHKHIEPKEGKTYFYSKLTACRQLSHDGRECTFQKSCTGTLPQSGIYRQISGNMWLQPFHFPPYIQERVRHLRSWMAYDEACRIDTISSKVWLYTAIRHYSGVSFLLAATVQPLLQG